MTRQERRKRRRQRRRMQAALLASLLFTLVLIVTLRIRETAPEPVAERTSALSAERQTLTYIAPARPEAAEETPEELTVEPEPENRYAELHFSDEDVYILACLVYHEARGESFEGQVAVVEVVLNRMLSEYFPDTVEEVVFQKYGDVWQFSPAPYLYSAEPDKEQYNRQKGGKRIEQAKKETRQQGRAGQLLKPCYRNPKSRDCYSTADRKAHRVKGRGRNPPCPPRITRNALNVKRP